MGGASTGRFDGKARKEVMMAEKKRLHKMGRVSAEEARAFIDKYRQALHLAVLFQRSSKAAAQVAIHSRGVGGGCNALVVCIIFFFFFCSLACLSLCSLRARPAVNVVVEVGCRCPSYKHSH